MVKRPLLSVSWSENLKILQCIQKSTISLPLLGELATTKRSNIFFFGSGKKETRPTYQTILAKTANNLPNRGKKNLAKPLCSNQLVKKTDYPFQSE